MANGFGASFVPNGTTDLDEERRRRAGLPSGQALQVLGLRLPRVLGAQAIAPEALLTGRPGQTPPSPIAQTIVDAIMASLPAAPTPPPSAALPAPPAAPTGPGAGSVVGGLLPPSVPVSPKPPAPAGPATAPPVAPAPGIPPPPGVTPPPLVIPVQPPVPIPPPDFQTLPPPELGPEPAPFPPVGEIPTFEDVLAGGTSKQELQRRRFGFNEPLFPF